MNYQDFITNVINHFEAQFGDDTTVQLQTIAKNNGTFLDALVITNTNINISPTIYLNPYYHRLLDGVSFEDICTDILDTYQSHMPKESIDISFFTDFDQVKERIIYKLVNFEQNQDLLVQIPHFRYLDFAITFHCLLNSSSEDYATIQIYNKHLDYWGITASELYELAKNNTPILLQPHLENMIHLISHLLPDDADTDELCPMYILSNQSRLNGASCILYDGLLQSISDQFEKDLVVIPSSIHEMLLIPIESADSLDEYTSMIQEVNETQLTDEEVLSDHAYFFSRKHGVLSETLLSECMESTSYLC